MDAGSQLTIVIKGFFIQFVAFIFIFLISKGVALKKLFQVSFKITCWAKREKKIFMRKYPSHSGNIIILTATLFLTFQM